MDHTTKKQLLDMLLETPVATLAVVVDGAPVTGLVPYALRRDNRAAWIHVSNLARHAQGLASGSGYSLLIHAPPDPDPLQTFRVSVQGAAARVPKDIQAYQLARETYMAKYPQSAMLFSFRDFNLYELRFTRGRVVAGFAKAYNLSPEMLAALGREN